MVSKSLHYKTCNSGSYFLLIWTCHMLIDSHIQSDRNGGLTFLIGLDLKE